MSVWSGSDHWSRFWPSCYSLFGPDSRGERGSIIVTSNLPFDEWTGVFGTERLTGALLDRLTYHIHILEMNSHSFRLKHNKHRVADDPQPTKTNLPG